MTQIQTNLNKKQLNFIYSLSFKIERIKIYTIVKHCVMVKLLYQTCILILLSGIDMQVKLIVLTCCKMIK